MQNLLTALQLIDQTATAFPPTNADGSSNVQAQSDAVKGTIDTAASSGVVDLSTFGIQLTQLEQFAIGIVPIIAAYKRATNRPSL